MIPVSTSTNELLPNQVWQPRLGLAEDSRTTDSDCKLAWSGRFFKTLAKSPNILDIFIEVYWLILMKTRANHHRSQWFLDLLSNQALV